MYQILGTARSLQLEVSMDEESTVLHPYFKTSFCLNINT